MMNFRKICTSARLFYERPKNLKNKKHSSQQWITRQLKDPFVEKAKQQNYRCRSAFKLIEIQNKHKILMPGQVVIDCGAAPGSWTQVSCEYTNANGKMLDEPVGHVIAIDRQPLSPIPGATIINNLDFTTKLAHDRIVGILDGKFADVVLSDMAPNATGARNMDHENIMILAYAAFKFALEISAYNACFVTKIWEGDRAEKFEQELLKFYKQVKIVKPPATRDESREKFFLAKGFKGVRVFSTA